MSKKITIFLVLIISIFMVALTGFYGVKPFNDNPTQATYLRWESEDLSLDDEGKVFLYLPYLEKNETKRILLSNYINLDSKATYGKDTLKYSILYDNEDEKSYLSLIESGTLAGWLTVSGQTTATIIVSTTDGSAIDARLYVRKTNKVPGEIIDGLF